MVVAAVVEMVVVGDCGAAGAVCRRRTKPEEFSCGPCYGETILKKHTKNGQNGLSQPATITIFTLHAKFAKYCSLASKSWMPRTTNAPPQYLLCRMGEEDRTRFTEPFDQRLDETISQN